MTKKNKLKNKVKKVENPRTQTVQATQPVETNEVYVSHGPNDLFEGVLAKSAISALSPEDKEKYRIIGQELYGKVDFANSKILNNNPDPIKEAISYIESQLKSGIHPSMLEDTEKDIMFNFAGPNWYESWGYTLDELNDFILV